MLLRQILLLGLAVLTAANPILDVRAGTTGAGTAIKGKNGGTKGKGAAQCKSKTLIQGPVTCARSKFTAAMITKAVKQAKALSKTKKKGKGLHFPAKYVPKKEIKMKGAGKATKGNTSKAVKRKEDEEKNKEEVEEEENTMSFFETKDEEDHNEWHEVFLPARAAQEEQLNILEARRGRGGGSRGARAKPVRKTKPAKAPAKKVAKKPAKKPATRLTIKPAKTTCTAAQKKTNGGKCPAKETCTAAQKKANGGKCPAKDTCAGANGKSSKPGKGVWMFPILKKGVWKAGAAVETNYVILDAKYNYVKTVDRDPGSVESYKTCTEMGRTKGGMALGGKATKGKTV